jgi:antigen 43
MTAFTVSTGITSTGLTVSSDDTWSIYGAAVSFTVVTDGTETVFSGGTASVTTVSGGGLNIAASGTAISTTISDGSATVDAGGTISFTTLDSGGYIFGNGTAISTTANDGSFDNVQDGGTASFTTVHHGGSEEVANGGLAVSTTVSSGGYDTVYAGGSASFTTVSNHGFEYVGQETIADGITVSTMVDVGGTQDVYFSGIASFTTVSSGGYQKVSAGGVAIDTSVLNGGFAIVASGGTETVSSGAATGVTLSGGGETVDSGGTAISTTVDAGTSASDFGTVTVDAGGTISFTTINSGGYIFGNGTAISTTANDGSFDNVQNGGTASFTTVEHGGSEDVANGGLAVSTVVSSGGYDDVYAGGSASFTTVSNHGIEYVGDETIADGITVSTTVDSGGAQEVFVSGIASATSVSSGGVEVLSTGGSATSTTVSLGGMIDVTYLPFVSSGTVTPNSTTDVLSVTEGTQTYTQQLAGNYAGESFYLSPDSGSGTLLTLNTTPCYCGGTHILTDRGEVAVEKLQTGDRVVTFSGALRPISWVGHRHLDLTRHAAPELAQPIRVRADAIADGVPRRDLLVSPDHAVLLDGGLIPARLLVNGASIERAAHCATVTYYHVELETHDILLAEALPTESYLDTGNRGMFENADGPLTLHPDFAGGQQLRVAGSCRPYVDTPAHVEPIWHRLAMRAAMLGFTLPAEIETTDDPGFSAVAGGRTITPIIGEAGLHQFTLPRGNGPVHLVSRTARPCDLRPWVEDRRRLGVMISRLTLLAGAEVATIPLDHPRLTHGWWDIERDRASLWRWTNGNAVIELPGNGLAVLEVPAVLEVMVAGGLNYPIAPVVESDAIRTTITSPALRGRGRGAQQRG